MFTKEEIEKQLTEYYSTKEHLSEFNEAIEAGVERVYKLEAINCSFRHQISDLIHAAELREDVIENLKKYFVTLVKEHAEATRELREENFRLKESRCVS